MNYELLLQRVGGQVVDVVDVVHFDVAAVVDVAVARIKAAAVAAVALELIVVVAIVFAAVPVVVITIGIAAPVAVVVEIETDPIYYPQNKSVPLERRAPFLFCTGSWVQGQNLSRDV